MKRVAYLLTSFLLATWASSGLALAKSPSLSTGPLDSVVNEASGEVEVVADVAEEVADSVEAPVTEVVEQVGESLPPLPDVKKSVEDVAKKVTDPVEDVAKKVTDPVEDVAKKVTDPVKDVAKTVTKVVDKTTGDVGGAAENPGGGKGSGGDNTRPSSTSPTGRDKQSDTVSGSSKKAGPKIVRTANRSGKASKRGGAANPERDTDEVAAAGHTIEPAQVKGAQIIAPATEVDEPEGSGLSRTGVQILAWLILACWLLGTGATFVWRGRTLVRPSGLRRSSAAPRRAKGSEPRPAGGRLSGLRRSSAAPRRAKGSEPCPAGGQVSGS